jgi:endonuclease/exonuclease/phosphatase family metal-dependent hydrolase
MIRFHEADLIGVQEAHRRQLDEMTSDMPEYAWFGLCRTDGTTSPNPDNEFSAILYRKDRFEPLDGNTFWLSETPAIAGSKGWDAAFPRIVTWAKFSDKLTGKVFFHFNTHFDHLGENARVESAKLLVNQVREISGEYPVVITGDFNTGESSVAYNILTDQTLPFHFTDAIRVSKIPHHGPPGTFSSSFQLPGVGDYRIDFVFFKGPVSILKHAILSDSWDGRLASDHLPVMIQMNLN